MNNLIDKNFIVSSESPDLYTTKRLLIEAKKLKFKPQWINPYQYLMTNKTIKSDISQNNIKNKKEVVGHFFHRTTGIRYDDFDLLVSNFHQTSLTYKITNPLSSLELFRNKDRQSLFFNQHKLASIDTIVYRGELNEMYFEEIIKLSKKQKYIIKMVRGNQGIGVNLINGVSSLKSLLETFHALKDQKFIIQPFIEHNKEWRLFIIRNEIVGIIERTINNKNNDFRGNAKRSIGKMVKKINPIILTEALRGASLSGLDYCGVDIITDGDQFKFLEFNCVPGFEQLEELAGLNIARELILKI